MTPWVLLIYSVPRQPSAKRVYIWRKLKQLGAETLQDAIRVLPANPRTYEQLQWLAAEIREMGGAATLWRAELADARQCRALIQRFEASVAEAYQRLLKELRSGKADRAAIAKRYQQVRATDFFACRLGRQVRAALLRERTGDVR